MAATKPVPLGPVTVTELHAPANRAPVPPPGEHPQDGSA